MLSIKTIEIYEVDGVRFDRYDSADQHFHLARKAQQGLQLLKLHKNYGTDFSNGKGYLSISLDDFSKAKSILDEIKNILMLSEKSERYMYESLKGSVFKLFQAISFLSVFRNNEYRIYGQPYFALNPEKAENFVLA